MKLRMLILALALALGACSKVTEENFAKVQVGMSEQEVVGILGSPTESDSVTILGVSGTAWQWKSGNAVASVQFVNGKVTSKIWEKPSAAQGGGTPSGY
jgi:hypothetical protein